MKTKLAHLLLHHCFADLLGPRIVIAALAIFFLFGSGPSARSQATANPPDRMSYQGFLVDANGIPLASTLPANYPLVFRIYNVAQGGSPLWSEQQIVTLDKGNFSVMLGEGSTVGSELRPPLSSLFVSASASDRYVGVAVTIGASTSELAPRLRLVPSPYSFLATSAANLVQPNGSSVVSYANGRTEIAGNVFASGVFAGNGSGLSGLLPAQIPNLDAVKIVTGTFADARIPNLDAGKIVSGAFNDARIPATLSGNRNFSGNVGIGSTAPGYPLVIGPSTLGDKISLWGQSGAYYGLGVAGNLLQIHTDTGSSDVAFGYGTSGGMTETMRIKGNGNAGIGTSFPTERLQLGDFSTGNGFLALKTAGGNLYHTGVKFRHFNDTIGYTIESDERGPQGLNFLRHHTDTPATGTSVMFLEQFSGHVGIGTTAPLAPLHIKGTGANNQITLEDSANSAFKWSIYSSATDNLVFLSDKTGHFRWFSDDGNLNGSSDIRLKKDVAALGGVLDRVLKLRPVSYRFKSTAADAPKSIGFIAQEVEPLFPELVSEERGMKGLAYSAFGPIAIAAIQELHAESKSLREENAALRTELSQLASKELARESRLADLESMVKRLAQSNSGAKQAAQVSLEDQPAGRATDVRIVAGSIGANR